MPAIRTGTGGSGRAPELVELQRRLAAAAGRARYVRVSDVDDTLHALLEPCRRGQVVDVASVAAQVVGTSRAHQWWIVRLVHARVPLAVRVQRTRTRHAAQLERPRSCLAR